MEGEQIEMRRRQALAMLKQYNANKVQLEMLTSKLRELERRTDVGVGAVSYDQPTAGATNAVNSITEKVVISKMETTTRLQNELARVQGQIERIDIALNNLPYAQRTVLELRYIERLSWRLITFHLSYSEDYLRKELHDSALDMLTGFLFPELAMVGLFGEV